MVLRQSRHKGLHRDIQHIPQAEWQTVREPLDALLGAWKRHSCVTHQPNVGARPHTFCDVELAPPIWKKREDGREGKTRKMPLYDYDRR